MAPIRDFFFMLARGLAGFEKSNCCAIASRELRGIMNAVFPRTSTSEMAYFKDEQQTRFMELNTKYYERAEKVLLELTNYLNNIEVGVSEYTIFEIMEAYSYGVELINNLNNSVQNLRVGDASTNRAIQQANTGDMDLDMYTAKFQNEEDGNDLSVILSSEYNDLIQDHLIPLNAPILIPLSSGQFLFTITEGTKERRCAVNPKNRAKETEADRMQKRVCAPLSNAIWQEKEKATEYFQEMNRTIDFTQGTDNNCFFYAIGQHLNLGPDMIRKMARFVRMCTAQEGRDMFDLSAVGPLVPSLINKFLIKNIGTPNIFTIRVYFRTQDQMMYQDFGTGGTIYEIYFDAHHFETISSN